MMDYHTVMWKANQDRHDHLLETALNHRLIKNAQARRLSHKDRALMNVGALLIDLGMRLKNRHEPAAQWSSSLKSS
jgi:hypothetical protein